MVGDPFAQHVGHITKMKDKGTEAVSKQLTQLDNMKGKKMKKVNKQWINARINIIKQFCSAGKAKLQFSPLLWFMTFPECRRHVTPSSDKSRILVLMRKLENFINDQYVYVFSIRDRKLAKI